MSSPGGLIPANSRQTAPVAERSSGIKPLGPTRYFSLRTLVGLPLLWASMYFVPLLDASRAYLLPSNDLIEWIVLPSLVAVAAGALLLLSISPVLRWINPRIAIGAEAIGLTILAITAVKVLFLAAGYRWEQLIPTGGYVPLGLSLYLCKYGFCFGILAVMWAGRGHLRRWTRLLSGLGLSLGVLAAIRIFFLWNTHQPTPEPSTGMATPKPSATSPVPAGTHVRRVVWVIFDESDYNRMYGAEAPAAPELTNFARLARSAVFATNANSPAGSTLYSIPALLAGVPIGGDGIRFDRSAAPSLEETDGTIVPFDERATIFGALAAGGRTASVLGFYHPYCKLFTLQRCDSFPWPQVGGWTPALWGNAPVFLSNMVGSAYFGEVTENLLRLLPEYLARDDALTFVHLNLPHLPASYADKALHLPASRVPLEEYSRNLILADRVLGRIITLLERQSSEKELLLVVSTDHWLRNWSYGDPAPEVSRKVPFIAWKVGATQGEVLTHPLSTVHTASMILDYLDGKISSQSEIGRWWEDKPVYPSFMVLVKD